MPAHRSKRPQADWPWPSAKVEPPRPAAIAAEPGENPVLDLDRFVPALLVKISDRLTSGSSRTYRQNFRVGITEWRIMARLAIEPWSPPQAIGQLVGLDKAAVSRSIRVLERRMLVEVRPHPSDNRSYVLALTQTGRRLHNRILRVALEREERLLSCLTMQERDQFIDMLNRLQRRLPLVDGPIEIPGEPTKI